MNGDICNFLSSLAKNRESFESYFTSKEMFDNWKEQKINYFSSLPLIKKVYVELDNVARSKLRNELLECQFQEKANNNK